MKRGGLDILGWTAALGLMASVSAAGQSNTESLTDSGGDASIRRTDTLGSEPDGQLLNPDQVQAPIDLRRVVIGNWQIANPAMTPADPSNQFMGSFVSSQTDNRLLCVQIQLYGLVNPPGALGSGGHPYEPFAFGPRPVYGFVDLDVDHDRRTGGDLTDRAFFRFLANAARFGSRVSESWGSNGVIESSQLDLPFGDPTRPVFEASGAEFSVVLCGCEPLAPVWPAAATESGAQFTSGSTWVLEGRVFQRASGFRDASRIAWMTRPEAAGLYDPVVRCQFSHDLATDRTTISIVYPTNAAGVQLLDGLASPPAFNNRVEEDGNHGCVQEALRDLTGNPNSVPFGSLARELTQELWELSSSELNELDKVTDWRIQSAMVGTAYPAPQGPLSLFVWTDIAPEVESRGDLDSDGMVTGSDRQALAARVLSQDALDGATDCAITITGWPLNFSTMDINFDGQIDRTDADLLSPGSGICCPADFNGDDVVSVQDIFDFLNAWFAGNADFNGDAATSVQDLFDYLSAYFSGCA